MTNRKKTSALFTRWKPKPIQIDDQQRLEQQLNQVTDAVEFGPVPGAYFPLTWNIRGQGGPIPAGILGSYCLPTGYQGQRSAGEPSMERTWSLVPIFISAFIDRGQLDFAITSNSTAASPTVLQQGAVYHPTNVIVDVNPASPPAWDFAFYQLIAPPPVPNLGDPGICVKWEQAVDFPVSPVPDDDERFANQIQLQVVNVVDVLVLSVFMIFKQVSKVDNYRKS